MRLIILILGLIIILQCSCMSFKRFNNNFDIVSLQDEIENINGTYHIAEIDSFKCFFIEHIMKDGVEDNANFNCDDLKNSTLYLQVLDNKTLQISIQNSFEKIITEKIKIRQKYGFVELKSKNVRFKSLVLLSRFLQTKYRIGKLNNGNLIVEQFDQSTAVIGVLPFGQWVVSFERLEFLISK